MRKKLAFLGLVAALFLLVGCQSVQNKADHQDTWQRLKTRKTVVIGLDDSFVPMGFRRPNGQLVGYDIDLAKAVFKNSGLKVSFQTIDWSLKETELRNGTIDLIWNGYNKTPQRSRKVGFSQTYLANRQILVTKRADQIKSFDQMTGKDLGVQNGSTAQSWLDQNPKQLRHHQTILYDTMPNAFLDLKAGRIQGILLDEVYAKYYVNHLKDKAAYRLVIDPRVPKDYFAVGMRRGDRTLRRKINQGLQKMRQNGEMARLQKKWFGQ